MLGKSEPLPLPLLQCPGLSEIWWQGSPPCTCPHAACTVYPSPSVSSGDCCLLLSQAPHLQSK